MSDWVDFIKNAEPYDSKGILKNRWKEVIEMMERNGEKATAKNLLAHYKAFLLEEAVVVKEQVDLRLAPKTVEDVNAGSGLGLTRLEVSMKGFMRVDSLRIKIPTLPKETSLLKLKPLPKTEPLLKTEPLSRRQFPFSAEHSFHSESSPEIASPLKVEVPSKTESLLKSELVQEDISSLEIILVKEELPPEKIPLPPSPLLQCADLHQNTIPLHDTKRSPGTESEKASAIHTVTNSNTNISVVDISSNDKVSLSVSPLATGLPSATPRECILQTNTQTSTDTPPLDF